MVCAGAGTERLWPHVELRRTVHLRVTFAAPDGARGRGAARSWGAATWADRSGGFGARTYGVADGPGRFALGLAELDAQPVPADPRADGGRRAAGPRRRSARGCTATRARRSRASARRSTRSSACSPSSPATTRTPTCSHREPGLAVLAGHNLFKLAPLLGERARARHPVTRDTLILSA